MQHTIFTYFGHRRQITSCLIVGETGTVLARGLAICSPRDQPNRKRGRTIAYGRALKAIQKANQNGVLLMGWSPIQRLEALEAINLVELQEGYVFARDRCVARLKMEARPTRISEKERAAIDTALKARKSELQAATA